MSQRKKRPRRTGPRPGPPPARPSTRRAEKAERAATIAQTAPPKSSREPVFSTLLGGKGERPKGLWGDFPLSELVLLVGVVLTVIGFAMGPDGQNTLLAGLGVSALAVTEFTAREHFSGFRSHATLLAFLPVTILLGVVGFVFRSGLAVQISLLPLAAIFVLLFRFLRNRFEVARMRRGVSQAGR